jgi:hypothetical protein
MREKSGLRSVNESFSKPLEFSESFSRILVECAQKREQPVQARLLTCEMRRNGNAAKKTGHGYGTGTCSF